MKFSIFAAIGAVCVFSASALHAQGTKPSTKTTTTTVNIIKGPRTRPVTPPAVTVTPRTDGVIPRAIRSGSPLQMINPFAPTAYGNGADTTRREPSDPNARPQGIKLVTFEF